VHGAGNFAFCSQAVFNRKRSGRQALVETHLARCEALQRDLGCCDAFIGGESVLKKVGLTPMESQSFLSPKKAHVRAPPSWRTNSIKLVGSAIRRLSMRCKSMVILYR